MAAIPDYYQLLNLENRQHDEVLPAANVKNAYRRALLQYHPDKVSQKLGQSTGKINVSIDEIALAFKTLSEPKLRAEYDRWLRSNANSEALPGRPHHIGLETVDLDDLDFDPETSTWTRGCRCGDKKGYNVSESELDKNIEDGELIVGCKGCSLWLRVLFGVEE